jgi:hypothetical protein
MTRFIRASVAALVLTLPALILPASTLAAGSTVSSVSFKGQTADAYFQSRDGCVQTTVGVFAVDGHVKQKGSHTTIESYANVFIDIFNSCTGTSHLSAFGETELAPGDFAVSSTLSTASLTTSIEVFDYISRTSFQVDIDLDWSGVGSTSREKGRFSFKTPGFRISERFDRTSRNATATGTVSDGCPNYTPGTSQFARLSDQKSGTKVVEKLAPVSPPISPPISPPVSAPVRAPVSPPISPPISPPVSPPCPTDSATIASQLSSPTALLVEFVLAGILLIAFGAGLYAARAVRLGIGATEAVPARAT